MRVYIELPISLWVRGVVGCMLLYEEIFTSVGENNNNNEIIIGAVRRAPYFQPTASFLHSENVDTPKTRSRSVDTPPRRIKTVY